MPSGRTSMPALQATDLLATLPACSGRRQNHPCRLSHECKLGDQTKDDADKEPREKRSCGLLEPRCTTGDDRIRALTTAPRIKPTSIFLRSARRPNPGRRSTYRRGIIVQTTGTGSV